MKQSPLFEVVSRFGRNGVALTIGHQLQLLLNFVLDGLDFSNDLRRSAALVDGQPAGRHGLAEADLRRRAEDVGQQLHQLRLRNSVRRNLGKDDGLVAAPVRDQQPFFGQLELLDGLCDRLDDVAEAFEALDGSDDLLVILVQLFGKLERVRGLQVGQQRQDLLR